MLQVLPVSCQCYATELLGTLTTDTKLGQNLHWIEMLMEKCPTNNSLFNKTFIKRFSPPDSVLCKYGLIFSKAQVILNVLKFYFQSIKIQIEYNLGKIGIFMMLNLI